MKVNEQWLMSLSTDLDNLGDLFAGQPEKLINLNSGDLQYLLYSLRYCETQLTELLASRHRMYDAGEHFDVI